MKVKKFTGTTMPEVMQQIRTELGRDAVILQSKEVKKGGVLGFFQRKQIEVVAGLDPDPLETNLNKNRVDQPMYEDIPDDNIHKQERSINEENTTHILSELKQMKQLIHVTQSPQSPVPSTLEKDYIIPYLYLIEQEIDQPIAEDIVLTAQQTHEQHDVPINSIEVERTISQEIEKRILDVQGDSLLFEKQIIHFIGPTGVGKTTTIAKMAAKAMLEMNKTVAFITTDTYRIAAIEQLKTYARILEVPVEVAYSKDDYVEALAKHRHVDHIFVDTAGRNFRESHFVEELSELIEVDAGHQATMLVLSLSTKESDMIAIFNQFRHIPNKQLIFTKLDETSQFGLMFNFVVRDGAVIACLTNGQDVPEDVLKPTAETLRSYVMSRYNDE